MNLFNKLMPREDKFHNFLEEATAVLNRAAAKFLDLINNLDKMEARCNDMKLEEHAGDEVVEKIIKALDRSFITPFDREDIHSLATKIDDVLDHMEEVAHRFLIFKISQSTSQARKLAEIIQKSCLEIEHVVRHCRKMKDVDTIHKHLRNIIDLENEGDRVYREASKELYDDPKDILHLSKWRELYDRLEKTIDSCKDVCHVLSEITIKNS